MDPAPSLPAPAPPHQPAAITGYPVVLRIQGVRFIGRMFPAASRLYFVCAETESAWDVAALRAIGVRVTWEGGVPIVLDELVVYHATQAIPDSAVMEAAEVGVIKHTLWRRLMRWGETTIAFPQGLSPDLRAALGRWCAQHGVPHAGLG